MKSKLREELLIKSIISNLNDKEIENKEILIIDKNNLLESYYSKNNKVSFVCLSKDILSNDSGALYEKLKGFYDKTFDVIILNVVLEYIEDQKKFISEINRILKLTGILSLISLNRAGIVLESAVKEENLDLAHKLIEYENCLSNELGSLKLYEDGDISNWINTLEIVERYGIDTFNQENGDINKIFELDKKVSNMEVFRRISYYHQMIFVKKEKNYYSDDIYFHMW